MCLQGPGGPFAPVRAAVHPLFPHNCCAGTDALKQSVMRALGRSSLFKHVARQVFAPNATMQAVVDSRRGALLLLYDGWGRDARFEVTGADGTKVCLTASAHIQ